jgi:hypothetical protein
MSSHIERWHTAVHEASHGCLAHATGAATVDALDIIPGLCYGEPCAGRTRLTWSLALDMEPQIITHLAGPVACLVRFDEPLYYDTNDFHAIEKHLLKLEPPAAGDLYRRLFDETLIWVCALDSQIERVAKELMVQQYLIGSDFLRIIGDRHD